ncbi:hypothetical protein HKD37_13G035529 [Glycine soja]
MGYVGVRELSWRWATGDGGFMRALWMWKTCCAPSPDRHLVPHVMEWYLEICRGGQETLGTSGGVLLPKTKLDQSRPNPGIIVMAAQLIRDRVEMECLEGAWETLEGNTRCRFRGTIRFTATSWCIQMNLHGRFSARWSRQLLGLVLCIF